MSVFDICASSFNKQDLVMDGCKILFEIVLVMKFEI